MATKFSAALRLTIALAMVFAATTTTQAQQSSRRTVPRTTAVPPKTTTAPRTAQPPKTAVPVRPNTAVPQRPVTAAPPANKSPVPAPPMPQREDDAKATTPKRTIPHPGDDEPTAATPTAAKTVEIKSTDAKLAPIGPDADGKYLLRYHFSGGETLRWQVEHRAKIITSVQDTTQTAETVTISEKVWRVVETLPGGEAKFIHFVDRINMKQKVSGRNEEGYDSAVDKEAPPRFADAAKQIGVPLAEVTIDTRGNVLKRLDKQNRPEGAPTGSITLILPDKPVAIGETWNEPFDLTATDATGKPKTIKARHKLTFEKVDGDTAVLFKETQILSPVDDPAIEAQVLQSEQSGTVLFDLRHGRIKSQMCDLDKEVFGFQGAESKLHYIIQFHETLEDGTAPKTATTPSAATKK